MQLRADDRAHDDSTLVSRAVEEDKRIASVEKPGDRTWVDTLVSPFNRAKENRDKVLT